MAQNSKLLDQREVKSQQSSQDSPQNESIAHLRSLLESTKALHKKLDILFELYAILSRSDPKQALSVATEAKAIAHQMGDTRLVAQCIHRIGTCNRYLANYNLALTNCQEAHRIFVKLKDEVAQGKVLIEIGIVYRHLYMHREAIDALTRSLEIQTSNNDQLSKSKVLNSLGIVYSDLGDYLKAIDYYYKTLKIRESLAETNADIERLNGNLLNNLGIIYGYLEEYRKALQYFEQGLAIQQRFNDRRTEAMTLGNIGEIHLLTNDRETALSYLNRSLNVSRELGDKAGEATTLVSIGSIYKQQDRLDVAGEHLQKAMDIAREVDYKTCYARANLHLGQINSRRKNYRRAVKYLEEALSTAKSIQDKSVEYETHESLSEIYGLLDLPWKALEHARVYAEAKHEVQKQQNQREIAEMQARFNVEKAENEKEIFRLRNVELTNALRKVESLNDHLLQLNDEKNTLLGILAHDLRNPLTGITTSVSMSKSYFDRLDQDEILDNIEYIGKLANRMNTIISNLLDVNKIEAGHWELDLQVIDLVHVASVVATEHIALAHAKDISVIIKTDDISGKILADDTALRNVLDNLISNAIKFSAPGTEVVVQVYERLDKVGCSVIDQGPGFTAEDKSRMFNKFARLSAKPTAGEHSTGLGLSIVKKLVELMKGNVTCSSEVGKGANLMIEFPRYLAGANDKG